MNTVKHAVILLAGKGTRFLPATKAVAKEIFPIGNKPALLFLLKECLDSGIKEVTLVLSKQKKDIIKFLKHDKNIEDLIKGTNKERLLDEWREIIDNLKFNFTYQGKMNGSAGAVLAAKKYTKNEPFIVFNGDDVYVSDKEQKPAAKQLIECFEKTGKNVLGCLKVSDDIVDRYGIVIPGDKVDNKTVYVKGFKEKPKKGEQPSNLAALGRYLVVPEIYQNIFKIKPSVNGEVNFPEAIALEVEKNNVLAYEINSKYYDLGNKLEFIKCTIETALKDMDIKEDLIEYLKGVIN